MFYNQKNWKKLQQIIIQQDLGFFSFLKRADIFLPKVVHKQKWVSLCVFARFDDPSEEFVSLVE